MNIIYKIEKLIRKNTFASNLKNIHRINKKKQFNFLYLLFFQ